MSSYLFASSYLVCLFMLTIPLLTPKSGLFRTCDAAFKSFLHQCRMTRNMEMFDAFSDVDEAWQHHELVVDTFWKPNTDEEEEDKSVTEA